MKLSRTLQMRSDQTMSFVTTFRDGFRNPVRGVTVTARTSDPEIAVLDGFKVVPTGKKFGKVVLSISGAGIRRRKTITVVEAPIPTITIAKGIKNAS